MGCSDHTLYGTRRFYGTWEEEGEEKEERRTRRRRRALGTSKLEILDRRLGTLPPATV